MKKILLPLALTAAMFSETQACAWADPDYDYFNLFTQTIIKDKSYLPFLHNYSARFFTDFKRSQIPDENIGAWRKYFNSQLSYSETEMLVNKIPMSDLNDLKKGNTANPLLRKMGAGFHGKYREGIDYLIEAKYLEPYMRINYVETGDNFYYRENENQQNATQIDYAKTVATLTSLYNAAKNPEIKQRYGYQLVRFNHYTRNYEAALQAFRKFVQNLQPRGAVYYMSVDQLAGAQRGLQMNTDANWNFFQVFKNSQSRKESAFVSMKLSDSASFNNILKKTETNADKNMAYFLLGYEDFTNPIPMMEKMYAIDPSSEILKVMAARSINELERNYLPTYYYESKETVKEQKINTEKKQTAAAEPQPVKKSFWQKIVSFFKNLFSSDDAAEENKNDKSDGELLENPNRIPFLNENQYSFTDKELNDNFLNELEKFTAKTKEKSSDEYWQIADAYLKFLKKDYAASTEILENIKTTNPEYLEEIKRMTVLNDIVAQPKIDAEYENHLMEKYASYFTEQEPVKSDSVAVAEESYYDAAPSTAEFLKDVLANRYFLQGEDGKSFLMNNKLSDLQYNPNSALVKSVEAFYRKADKTEFEKQIIAKNIDDVKNIDAFFAVIYGDRAMKTGDFAKAKSEYAKAKNFAGIPRENYERYNPETGDYEKLVYNGTNYDGFHNIPDLVFGHNVWESFQSTDSQSMTSENLPSFSFIKTKMDKSELADAAMQLKKLASGKDQNAAAANQLLGNLLYNTSNLGYYRQLFVMDVDNSNGGKYNFWTTSEERPYQFYYKNFTDEIYIEPDNFNIAIGYYTKALNLAKDREQKARVLFQMASAEQGKYYQYEAKNPSDIDYSDPQYSEKSDQYQQKMNDLKNQKFRSYFAQLKNQYSDTETAKTLLGSCSYFEYFVRR